MAIRLYENFRGLLYAPFFAAHALGAYDAEDVAVELKESPEPGLGARQVLAGNAELTWGGPMRVMQLREHQPGSDLMCFCEVVCRDPFSLVGRGPRPSFKLADLAGLKMASVSEVPTPWLCLQEDIRRAGLDPDKLDRVTDRSMADNTAALLAGKLDVVQLFEPYVSQALAAGATIWQAGADRGLTAYTSFYTTQATFDRHSEEFRRMTRAMYRTLKWVHAATPDAFAAKVASFYPSVDRATLTASLARYQQLKIWNQDPVLRQEGYERLRAGLISGGLVKHGADYGVAVDTSLAAQAVKDNPAAL